MLSVVLVNWNGWSDTIACVQSLLAGEYAPARIIVVDNDSSDGSIEALTSWSEGHLDPLRSNHQHAPPPDVRPRFFRVATADRWDDPELSMAAFDAAAQAASEIPLFIIRAARNGGFGFGCNVGLRLGHWLGSDGHWLLNNDCVVTSQCLVQVATAIHSSPDTLFGTVLRHYHRPDRIQAVGGGWMSRLTGMIKVHTQPSPAPRLNFINGASLILSRRCLESVGHFDESIFMYFEENDYCLRAENKGFRFGLVPVDVYHKLGGSQGGGATAFAWLNVLTNKHYVLKKNLGWGLWTLVFFGMLAARSILPQRGDASRIAARSLLRKLAFGR